jgi:hypothetical protein
MATKKASPAQLAARKRFAEMARSGAFKKRKKNPTAKKTLKQNPFDQIMIDEILMIAVNDANLYVGLDCVLQNLLLFEFRHQLLEVRPQRANEPVQVASHKHHHCMAVPPVSSYLLLQGDQLIEDGCSKAAEERVVPGHLIGRTSLLWHGRCWPPVVVS